MHSDTDKSLLIADVVIGGVFLFLGLTSLITRSADAAPIARFWTVVPYAIYGGTAIQSAFKHGYGDSSDLTGARAMQISEAIHGIAGIVLIPWILLSAWAVSVIKKKRKPYTMEWSEHRRNRGFFYIVLIDIAFIVSISTAVGFGSTYTPMSFGTCSSRSYKNELFSALGGDFVTKCEHELTIQIIAIFNVFVLTSQSLTIAPLIAPPRIVLAPIFLLARSAQSLRWSHSAGDGWKDIEKGAISEKLPEKQPNLARLFRKDGVAAALAKNLHYQDISNVSMASRLMHLAVFQPEKTNTPNRREVLCESACDGGTKTECWACAKVICQTCLVVCHNASHPRTEAHMESCYAVCTKCYLTRSPAHPAPSHATWNQHDLALQHANCSKATGKQVGEPVDLCISCARLDPSEIGVVREKREVAALKYMLKMKLRCKQCAKSLPQGSRRWWICGTGMHECHWAGHQV